MKFKKVVINNFKSFGEECNELILDNKITTIIGKNESGKSNILEALNQLNFFKTNNLKKIKIEGILAHRT